MRGFSKVFYFKSTMEKEKAKELLQKYSPKPTGTCRTQNKVDLEYDLQIIIPVYNAEKFILQCVNSVLNQKTQYKTIVTIINDGSTDSTQEILNKLQREKNNIKLEIIEQKNAGIAAARNQAMKVLKGKYIAFLDSDDILEGHAIDVMMSAACKENADILQGSWYTFDEREREEYIIAKTGIQGSISGFPWGKLYKWNVLEYFQYPEGFWFEDTPISFILAAMPYRSVAISDVVYGYRRNPDGITATAVSKRKSVDSYWIMEECLEEFPKFGLAYDQRAYEYLLRQSIMNEGRSKKQPAKIREAEFILAAELIEEYFKDMRTENRKMRTIEHALRARQFLKFEWLVRSM